MPMRGQTMKTLRESFMQNVMQGPGCWEWQRSRTVAGYGRLSFINKTHLAHRVSYELFNGPVPNGQLVCHHCDNPPCCRPDHLFIGTNKDNLADMIRKGRSHNGVGERNIKAKITQDIVVAIRSRYAQGGIRQVDLAAEYGISQLTISNIVTGKTWKHILL